MLDDPAKLAEPPPIEWQSLQVGKPQLASREQVLEHSTNSALRQAQAASEFDEVAGAEVAATPSVDRAAGPYEPAARGEGAASPTDPRNQ